MSKDIVIAIKKKYTDQIFAGTKRIEYRKRVPKDLPFTMYIYECGSKSVVGKATVNEIKTNTPIGLYNETSHFGGIDKESFMSYFGNNIAKGLMLTDVQLFTEPVDCENVPQSWRYAKDDEVIEFKKKLSQKA